MPRLHRPTLLPKISHVRAWTVGHEEIAGTEMETHTLLTGFVVPEVTMQAAGGELSPTFLLGYLPCVLKYQHARQDCPQVQ